MLEANGELGDDDPEAAKLRGLIDEHMKQVEQLKEHMEARAPAVGQSSAPRSEYVKWAEGVLTRAALRFYSLQSHGI